MMIETTGAAIVRFIDACPTSTSPLAKRRPLHQDVPMHASSGGTDSGSELGEPIWHPALRNLTSPKDANHQGSVFGGVILSLIDQAGYVEARRHGVHRWVTIAMQAVEFHQPVWMGDVVTLFTRTVRTGRTSVTVQVRVEAERYTSGEAIRVTEATMTLVATDAAGRPIPFEGPGASGLPTSPGGGRP
jgi:acyl-CoA thioesterase YciA